MAEAYVQIGSTDMRMYQPQGLTQEAVVVAPHWEAQEPPPPRERYRCQGLCTPGKRSIGCIVPFGLPATL